MPYMGFISNQRITRGTISIGCSSFSITFWCRIACSIRSSISWRRGRALIIWKCHYTEQRKLFWKKVKFKIESWQVEKIKQTYFSVDQLLTLLLQKTEKFQQEKIWKYCQVPSSLARLDLIWNNSTHLIFLNFAAGPSPKLWRASKVTAYKANLLSTCVSHIGSLTRWWRWSKRISSHLWRFEKLLLRALRM